MRQAFSRGCAKLAHIFARLATQTSNRHDTKVVHMDSSRLRELMRETGATSAADLMNRGFTALQLFAGVASRREKLVIFDENGRHVAHVDLGDIITTKPAPEPPVRQKGGLRLVIDNNKRRQP